MVLNPMPSSDLNLPPMTPSELPSSEGNNPLNAPDTDSGMLSLTQDQLQALGLEDCQPGDSYTIKITKSDAADGSDSFTVDDVSEDSDEATPGTTEQGDAEQPSPDDEGIPGESPAPDDKGALPMNDSNAGSDSEDEKVLGVKRKKKSPRAGLPDTKKMRDM